MDLATLIGLLGGVGVVLGAILMGSSISSFINIPSIVIVFGGTFMAVLMRYSIKQFFGGFKIGLKTFKYRVDSPRELIKKLVELSGVVRRDGLLALENVDVPNPLFKKGLRLCADGIEPEFVRKLLEEETDKTFERHETGQGIFKAIGDAAPAMGMIGTLIGLIQLLSNMEDPKSIGPAMAVALLTTLYGAVIANVVALPMAEKLKNRSEQEALGNSIIIEGIACLLEGRNPQVTQELLLSYLPKGDQQVEAEAAA